MATAPALQAIGLSLRRGGRAVVDHCSVELWSGQWVALVGPNGAGKSSLLSLFAGLQLPDEGQLRLLDRPMAAWPARGRASRLAWMAQTGEAEGDLHVRDVVRLGRLPQQGLLGAATAADEAIVDAAMDETETRGFADRRLNTLSGGERQRVLLARALAVQADVLLLDEPTAHLDAPHQRALIHSLRKRASRGQAVLSVLHDLTLALQADRVLVMHQGRLQADGSPGDAALRAALVEVFDGSLQIAEVHTPAGPRWVSLPAL